MSEWQQEERLFLHLGNERDTGGSGKRYFSRGGVKYALLELLAHEDMHGYQMMKALEEQSGGIYKPSAGSIYPTLQMLRDQGYVEPYKLDGKRVFQITEEGRGYLQEELDRPEPSESGEQSWEAQDQAAQDEGGAPPDGVKHNRRLTPRGKELIHLLKAAERAALVDAVKASQLRVVLEGLRRSLRLIVADTAFEPSTAIEQAAIAAESAQAGHAQPANAAAGPAAQAGVAQSASRAHEPAAGAPEAAASAELPGEGGAE